MGKMLAKNKKKNAPNNIVLWRLVILSNIAYIHRI